MMWRRPVSGRRSGLVEMVRISEQVARAAGWRFMSKPHPDHRAADALRSRGLTQSGETHDKIPGMDPAAAPMETDGEAGGFSNPQDPAVPVGKAMRPPETSYASAMRSEAGQSRARTGWLPPFLAYGPFLLIAVGGLILVAWLLV